MTATKINMGIFFYSPYGPYFELSNFYPPKKLIIDGKSWPTTEHYYQASKFPDHPKYMELIRTVKSSNKAKCLGNQKVSGYSRYWKHDVTNDLLIDIVKKSPNIKIMSTWDSFRITVTKKAIEEKFTQNRDRWGRLPTTSVESLLKILLDTGNRPIFENTARDTFWGNGGDGSGLNILGKLLMELRTKLRTSTNEITTLTFYDSEIPFQKSNWVLKNLIVGGYP